MTEPDAYNHNKIQNSEHPNVSSPVHPFPIQYDLLYSTAITTKMVVTTKNSPPSLPPPHSLDPNQQPASNTSY